MRFLLGLALLLLPTHVPAQVRIAEPNEDARVVGSTVRVVLVGERGDSPAAVRLDLDGQPVDATGKVGGVFSTLSVRPQAQVVLTVPVAPGAHTLTLTPNPDTDSTSPVVVRRFRVEADEPGSGGTTIALAGIAVLVAVGAAVAVRRRANAADAAPPGDRPAAGQAAP